MTFELDEATRIARHIGRAERALRARPATGEQRLSRALIGVALARYRRRGVFPRNTAHPEQTPVFVDEGGAPCAVAHLLRLSGQHALVDDVQRRSNHARVVELARDQRLAAWLGAAGLSVAEAQAIQPEYRPTPVDCVCGSPWRSDNPAPLSGAQLGPAEGVVVGVVTGVHEDALELRIRELHGDVGDLQVGGALTLAGVHLAVARDSEVLVPCHRPGQAGEPPQQTYALPIPLDAQGEYACASEDYAVGPVARDALVSVLMADDCRGTLEALDVPVERVHDGCALSGGVSPSIGSLAVLLCLASALSVRRATRNAHGTERG